MSRTKNSLRNVSASILGQSLIILFGFIARKVFIKYLPTAYLGLNGLFGSVLTVLSLAELGLGSAMIFSLYKPIAEKDTVTTQALMQLYKKAYRYIGLIVLAVGSLLTPFIPSIIKEIPPEISNIQLIYVLFVLNSAISYFFSYKRSFIIASQNRYYIDLVHIAVYFTMNLVQILLLMITGSYLLFLVVQIIATFSENLILTKWVNKKYTWLTETTSHPIPIDIKNNIVRNVKAMAFHRVGGIVMDATDSLLISKLFGLIFLGFYSNYLLIINALKGITQSFFTGIAASVGDFGTSNSGDASYQLYRKIQFFNFWLSAFCSISLLMLINPFISLIWLGEGFLIPTNILIVVIVNFYINSMRRTVLTFKEAYGLPWYDRYKPLIGAGVNLFVSIYLSSKVGIIGVFLGTTFTHLSVNVWWESRVTFNHIFERPLKYFFKEYIQQTFVSSIGLGAVYLLSIFSVTGSKLLNFILLIIWCAIVPNAIIILIYRKSEEFIFWKRIILRTLSNLKQKWH